LLTLKGYLTIMYVGVSSRTLYISGESGAAPKAAVAIM